MKLEPHLPQWPSIGELLEHPRVKGVVERLNRSTLAQRAAGFLDEMRSSLAERAGRVEIPPIAHLAERLARRLLGEPTATGPVINATGLAIGDPEWTPPLSEKALQAMLQTGGEYHSRQSLRMHAIEQELCAQTGAEAAHVACSFEAATMLASGVHAQSACRIDAEPLAGLLNPSEYGYQSIDTAGQKISTGADLVVFDGAGLLGGPACGVLIGTRRFIESARQLPLATPLALNSVVAAALEATLTAYRQSESTSVIFELPLWQLLSAPQANLRQRAERLARLMADSSAVTFAEPREVNSAWARRGKELLTAPSWAIVLKPSTGDVSSFAERLRRGPYPIAADEIQDAVQLDLRTVFPRWDQQLVAAVASTD